MKFTLDDGTVVRLIGDPHLGKNFDVNCPLHRRGDRRVMQREAFEEALDDEANLIIMVGDLFDHPYVSDEDALYAGNAFLAAARARPWVTFVAMAGNHDLPRNKTRKGAFDTFEAHVSGREQNLHVARKPVAFHGVMLFPWEWGVTARSQVRPELGIVACVGHWDLQTFDGKDDHLAPVKLARDTYGPVKFYSGHYHVAGDYVVDDFVVHCTGSLQPYSHGEDPEGTLYTTVSLIEAGDALPGKFRHMCVRVLAPAGAEVPDIDCLQLSVKRERADQVDQSDAVALDNFNLKAIVDAKLASLSPEVKEFINERLTA